MEVTHNSGQWDPRAGDTTTVPPYRSYLPPADSAYHSIEHPYHADIGPAQSHYVATEDEAPAHGYVGGQSPDSAINLAVRNNSIPSVASANDYSSSWSSTSPTISHSGTRTNSIYSLDGLMGHVSLNPLSDTSRFGQLAPGACFDRRFSLDERARPHTSGSGSLLPPRAAHVASSNGRHWPWGANGGPSIASAQTAGRASYDYGYSTFSRPSQSAGYPSTYDSLNTLPDASGRLRSMSSSAASGRHGNGGALSSAAGMAMGHYGSHLDLISPIDPHGSSNGLGVVGSQIGPGGGVTRRAKFKRSRTGCLICRKRKVKCSQDGTPCKQCRIGKRECYYEENPPKRKRKGKGDLKENIINGTMKGPVPSLPGKALSTSPVNNLYGQTTAPPSSVSFHMPFSSHDHHIADVAAHYTGPGPHEDAPTPTFGSAGWPVPPGAAHHRDSFSEHASNYDGSLDAAAPAAQSGPYGQRPGFDASAASDAVSMNGRDVQAVGHQQTNGAPLGLGHVMHPSSSGHAAHGNEAMWYGNGGSHHDQDRLVYPGEASTAQA